MSENVQLELIKQIPSILAALPSLVGGLSGMLAAYFAYKAHTSARETSEVARKTEENTNHLKDELVAEVRKAAHAEGVVEGRKENGEK